MRRNVVRVNHFYWGRVGSDRQAGVWVDGAPLTLENPRHSPDGYAWGYRGSGAAELARQLVRHHVETQTHLDEVGRTRLVERYYQGFKEAVVARWEMDAPWELTSREIQCVLQQLDDQAPQHCDHCAVRLQWDEAGPWCLLCEALHGEPSDTDGSASRAA
jgi:hypothetical protein